MFVRKKVINGRGYFYLVRSVRKGDRIRQECLEYLGPNLPAKRKVEELKRKHSK
ncbi:MAG: hypothetical protein V1875_00065 [Candidatus Altiarchaeota archaeon]